MEEEKKGGYSAEEGKLRPRRPRISGKVYSSSDEQRSSYNSGERRSYGSYNRQSDYGQRRSYGDGENRSYNRSYGDNNNGGDHGYNRGSYGNNNGGYNRSNNYGDRKSYGSSRGYGERRNSYGNQERSSSYGNHDHSSSYGSSERGGYNRDYGERRSYNNGERRSYGGYNHEGGNDRPRRNFSQGGKPQGNKRFGGKPQRPAPKKKAPGANAGINKMLSRKPQVSELQYSEIGSVVPEFKEEIRLNKYIANSGVCSRREADQMIQAGVVTVNGEVVTELGTKVNVLKDEVKFNGERLKGEKKVYLVMNKPRGYVTTTSDAHADKTVMDLITGCEYRVFPVGRLDKGTTGVLMLTNDGEIAEKLTHPSYDKKKIYQVTLDRPLEEEDFQKLVDGVTLGDGFIKADELQYIDANDHKKLGIEIHSGKNRIVRRMFESLGYDVKALDRVYFAGLTKKGLKKGEWRYLTDGEANILKMGAYV